MKIGNKFKSMCLEVSCEKIKRGWAEPSSAKTEKEVETE